jgi:hypothetical protein
VSDERKNQDLAGQLVRLTAEIGAANKQIEWMQTRGGFTDAKTHSMRATRLEERIDRLELQVKALLDVAAFNTKLLEDHLRDRHNVDLDRDDAIDADNWRKIRRRLRDLADKLGLTAKKRAVTEVRQSENQLRPSRAATA